MRRPRARRVGAVGRCCREELLFALGLERTYNGPDVWLHFFRLVVMDLCIWLFIYSFYLVGSGQAARKEQSGPWGGGGWWGVVGAGGSS